MADLRVPFTVLQDAFGRPATVTRPAPDDTPVQTDIVWMTPATEDVPGGPYQRRDPIRALSVSRADVPTIPRNTVVQVAEQDGADVRTWRVDATERVEADHVRVIVLPVSD